ncbi:MAG: hypothetical protein HZA88_14030 [Verrucomicrobia bacterium]|nr:hypothetical protein [Verrucomicrobiota bacterium]
MRGQLLLPAVVSIAMFVGAVSAADVQLYKRPITAGELRASTTAAVEKNEWDRHQQFVERAACDFLKGLPPPGGAQSFNLAVGDEVIGLAVAQAAFLRSVTTNALDYLSTDTELRPFLQWLLMHRPSLEDYRESVKRADDVEKVLQHWARLWGADPVGREKYRNLALACALVFDKPIMLRPQPGILSENNPPTPLDARERYLDFRNAAERGLLRTRLDEMAPWELIWVVNAAVPASELAWAREHMRLAQSRWGDAYGMVPWNRNRLLGSDSVYKEYTLAEIRKEGGICGDRAYFASITAKANGIPAMPLIGEGRRGGHAWIGFEAAPGRWDFTAGRFPEDRYATGYTHDPQTQEVIKEQSLYLLTDPQHRSPAYRHASRLIWLAEILAAQKQPVLAADALELAASTCSRHLPAWTALFDQLKQNAVPRAKCDRLLLAMRSAFRNYPDVLTLADRWETASAPAGTETAKTLRRQYRKLESRADDRTDLLMESIAQRAAALEKQGNLDDAERVYRDAITTQGRELVAFRGIASGYLKFAGRHNRHHEVLRHICSKFEELQREPHGDYFAMNAWTDVARLLADQLDKDNQSAKAKRLRRAADRLAKSARNLIETGLE